MRKICFVSAGLEKRFYNYLKKIGFKIFKINPLEVTYESINKHPDIFIFVTNKNIIASPKMYKVLKKDDLISNYLVKGNSLVKEKYPENISYNVFQLKEYAIHNTKYTDSKIKEIVNKKWIDVNQGYSNCSCLRVDDNSFITSDKGIYEKVKEYNIDCLLIRPGYINLKGLDYGFIGGTGFRYNNEIIFYGDISKHPDYEKIKEFINSKGLFIKSFDFYLEDIGSVIKFLDR